MPVNNAQLAQRRDVRHPRRLRVAGLYFCVAAESTNGVKVAQAQHESIEKTRQLLPQQIFSLKMQNRRIGEFLNFSHLKKNNNVKFEEK